MREGAASAALRLSGARCREIVWAVMKVDRLGCSDRLMLLSKS